MKKILFMLLLSAFLVPTFAFAETTNIPNTFPTVGRSIRALGMGNSSLTMKGTDVNNPLYNPASIRDFSNKITWSTAILPAPPVELSYSAIGLIRDVFNFKDDLDKATTTSAKLDVFNSFVDQHIGTFNELEVRLPIIAAYNRYFYAGVISDDDFAISFRNRAFPNFEIKATSYTGLEVGSSYGIFDERLQVGAMVKMLYGMENQQVVTSADILNNNFDDFKWSNWKRGLALGFDVGAKYVLHDFGVDIIDTLRPTFAVSYQDIGNTKFRWMKKNGGPTSLPQTVSAGFGIHPTIGAVETSVLVDIREINIKEEFIMKLNAGAEVRFPAVPLKPSIRGGVNQGYPTVGAGVKIWKLTWNAAFYGKELGETTREKCGYRLGNEFVWNF